MACSRVLSLPSELMLRIFKYADCMSMLRCQQVCRAWYLLMQDDELQYEMELKLQDVNDNCPGTLSIAERFRLLRHLSTTWDLDPDRLKAVISLPMPELGYSMQRFNMRTRGDTLTYRSAPPSKISIIHLRTSSDQEPQTLLEYEDGYNLPQYDVDQSQDVMVWGEAKDFCYRISIRSLTMEVAHPLATDAELCLSIPDANSDITVANIQLNGDLVAVTMVNPEVAYVVWNWKSGVQLCYYRPGDRFNSATLLDHCRYGLLICGDGDARTEGRLTLLDFGRNPLHSLSPTDQSQSNTVFLLPTPCTYIYIESFFIAAQQWSAVECSPELLPFHPSPNQLLSILLSGVSRRGRYSVDVDLRLIVRVSGLIAKSKQATVNREVPWSDWQDCVVYIKIFEYRRTYDVTRPLVGQRFVLPHAYPKYEGDPLTITMMDFNLLRVARAASKGLCPGETIEYSSSVPAGEWCDEELVIKHPYLQREVEIPRGIALPESEEYDVNIVATEGGLVILDEDDETCEVHFWPFGRGGTA